VQPSQWCCHVHSFSVLSLLRAVSSSGSLLVSSQRKHNGKCLTVFYSNASCFCVGFVQDAVFHRSASYVCVGFVQDACRTSLCGMLLGAAVFLAQTIHLHVCTLLTQAPHLTTLLAVELGLCACCLVHSAMLHCIEQSSCMQAFSCKAVLSWVCGVHLLAERRMQQFIGKVVSFQGSCMNVYSVFHTLMLSVWLSIRAVQVYCLSRMRLLSSIVHQIMCSVCFPG
jgi:hypothetical protein